MVYFAYTDLGNTPSGRGSDGPNRGFFVISRIYKCGYRSRSDYSLDHQ